MTFKTEPKATSLHRMLKIIDMIEESNADLITFDDLHSRLAFTRSTLYRYLKILTASGLVTSLPDVGFTLGPRITELDYKIRKQDPLILAARPVMAELVQAVPGISLLCRRYGGKVLCIYQESSSDAFHSSYERGRALPLTRGAASRIILANLQPYVTSRLFQQYGEQFKDAGLGQSLREVRSALKRIRQLGWDVTEGQVTPGVTGIAAPIFDNRGSVVGSLSLTVGRTGMDAQEIRLIADRVVFCTGIVTKAISQRSA